MLKPKLLFPIIRKCFSRFKVASKERAFKRKAVHFHSNCDEAVSGGFWGPIGRAFPWVAVGGGGGAVGHVANVSAL